ncbi:MAG: UvrD-helicase domain-containing protein, partial [Gammaproteobacteria bacterium]|nr:UvrD-helicase domain-containing protein [Gammaproteobacteria bacterium]
MDVTHILEGLNEAQREAVTASVGNGLVVAGAGSGKTRVLVHRIAWLVEAEGVSPHGVLAVTFTNKAAQEMRLRIEELLQISVRTLWVGTFHGIAHRLLRMHWDEARLPQSFQILDADDQLRLVKRVMRSLDLDEQKWPARQAVWFINGQKDEGRRAREVAAGDDVYQMTHKKIYESYEEVCQRAGLVDFAELLLRSHELWLQHADLLGHYQARFEHILVDEFQDTNTIQYAWLRVLAGKQSHIMAVGDDDQSIYGWRGAKIENIHRFSHDFQDVQMIRLEQNYRSTATILNAANGLIQHNVDRLGKKLWTDGPPGEPIRLYSGYNDLDEARFITERAQEWIDNGGSPDDVAVLYRSNAQSRVLEEALLRAQIPYRIYGGQRFFERIEIKNALSYMRLIHERNSDPAFERVINTPSRGIGDKTVEAIRQQARTREVAMWQACVDGLVAGSFTGRVAGKISDFLQLIDDLASATQEMSLHELADHVIEA